MAKRISAYYLVNDTDKPYAGFKSCPRTTHHWVITRFKNDVDHTEWNMLLAVHIIKKTEDSIQSFSISQAKSAFALQQKVDADTPLWHALEKNPNFRDRCGHSSKYETTWGVK